MRTLLLGIVTLISLQTVSAQDSQLDSLYRVLDYAILHSPEYVAKHRQSIKQMQLALIHHSQIEAYQGEPA